MIVARFKWENYDYAYVTKVDVNFNDTDDVCEVPDDVWNRFIKAEIELFDATKEISKYFDVDKLK